MPEPTRSSIQRSANLHENTSCTTKAEGSGFRSCRHNRISYLEEFDYSSAALKYAGVSAETQLRLEDPALHLSISCLHLAIVDLLNVILDRYCFGIQVFKSIAGPEYINACTAQSWPIIYWYSQIWYRKNLVSNSTPGWPHREQIISK